MKTFWNTDADPTMIAGNRLRRYLVALGTAVFLTMALACSEDSRYTYFESVKPIIDERCVGCHTTGGLAPFSLETYDDVVAHKDLVEYQIINRTMPPWYAAQSSSVYYANDASLSAAQIATISEWVEDGVAKGDPAQEPPHHRHTLKALTDPDITLSIPEPYTPKNTPDDYHCFVFDWPRTTHTFVTGMGARPDSTASVHHIAAYLIPPGEIAGIANAKNLVEQYDTNEPGIGYTCWGGPAGGNSQVPAQQLGQWVPGISPGGFPEGTGIRVQPGSKVVVQIHYNTLTSDPQPDQSEVVFTLADTVAREAAFAPWLNVAWPTLKNMQIKAGDADVRHSARGQPERLFEFLNPGVSLAKGFRIHSILMHMHDLGKRATVNLLRHNGDAVNLLQLRDWDFDWQIVYELAEPVEFSPGDELFVECRWDNSRTNQPLRDGVRREPINVTWGEGTEDEMCVANLYISIDGSTP